MNVFCDNFGWDDVRCVVVEYVGEDVAACGGDGYFDSDVRGCSGG